MTRKLFGFFWKDFHSDVLDCTLSPDFEISSLQRPPLLTFDIQQFTQHVIYFGKESNVKIELEGENIWHRTANSL